MKNPHYSATTDESQYRGVRKRKCGKWVSEIHLPNSRDRIWLGSYDTPDKAARAFDFAAVYLRGPSSHLNFPSSPPQVPGTPGSLTHQQIQVAAAHHANAAAHFQPPLPPPRQHPAEEGLGGSPAAESSSTLMSASEVSSDDDWSFMDMLKGPDAGRRPGFFSNIDDEWPFIFFSCDGCSLVVHGIMGLDLQVVAVRSRAEERRGRQQGSGAE